MKKKQKKTPRWRKFRLMDSVLNSRIYLFIFKTFQAFGNWLDRVSYTLISKKKAQYIFSLICAVLLSISCYFIENQPYEFSDRSFLFYTFEMPFRQWTQEFDRKVKFINVSHDRCLVPIDPDDPDIGNTDITDRGKLLQFFERLEEENVQYQAIMLDLCFEKDLRTEYDSALFHKIASMRNIVVAHHFTDTLGGYEIADTVLLDKAGFADYKQVAYENDFFRYSFIQEQGPSLALKLYDMVREQPTSIKKWPVLPVYVCKRHLCINCPLLPVNGDVYDKWSSPVKEGGKTNFNLHYNYYEDLGGDWLIWDKGIRDWQVEFDNAYIIIGDYENDVHDTYAGPRSGAFINWLAYMFLEEGNHMLSWVYILLTFVFYAFLIYLLFFLSNIARKPENKNNGPLLFLLTILRWLGTLGLLYLMTFLLYKIFKMRYNVTIPIFFIAIVNFIIQNANKHEEDIASDRMLSDNC